MEHMGDGVHWHNNARSRSRCQNLRLPYFFLISELNTGVGNFWTHFGHF